MKVTAWNNGQHSTSGAGYGVKLSLEDRDEEFDRRWRAISMELEGGPKIEINVEKDSFWNHTCRELIHAEIGRWLRGCGLAPWPKGEPPKLELVRTGEAQFALRHRS